MKNDYGLYQIILEISGASQNQAFKMKSSFHLHLGIAKYIWRQNTFYFSLLEEEESRES